MSRTRIHRVSQEEVLNVIDFRTPLGVFLTKDGRKWVAVDNTTGDAWTEGFSRKHQATRWLRGKFEIQKEGVVMRVLVVEPERRPEVREIDDSLKAMQEIVGGLIQPIYLDDSVVLICNDEGKMINLPMNRGLRDKGGQIYDIVSGTFFLCGIPADSDHFTSLTQEQIERYKERFHTPEMFWGMDGHIVCLPLEVD